MRVKIYATDVDEEAPRSAAPGELHAEAGRGRPGGARARSTSIRENGRCVFRKDLRRAVIFGRHDLLQDAPISRIDLLACRNTLMYFNAETQIQILSELPLRARNDAASCSWARRRRCWPQRDLFEPVDLKRRVFAKVAPGRRCGRGDRRPAPRTPGRRARSSTSRAPRARPRRRPRRAVVVDATGALALANQQARIAFGLAARDIGRPDPGPRALVPARSSSGRASSRPTASTTPSRSGGRVVAPARRRPLPRRPGRPAVDDGRAGPGRRHQLLRRPRYRRQLAEHEAKREPRPRTRSSRPPSRSSRRRTRSSRRPTRSSRRRTRSSSPPTRSSRRRTRSSSRPTRSSRR